MTSLILIASILCASPGDVAPDSEQRAEPELSRFYFHEGFGLGFWVASSRYTNGSRDVQSASINLVTTIGGRISQGFAIGFQLELAILPAPHVTEDRSLGHKDFDVPFGIAGTMGPSFTFLPAPFRFELTPGFLWVVTGAATNKNSGGGATLGGFGPALTAALGLDAAVGQSVRLGGELRATVGGHFNGDSTHTGGWDTAMALLFTIRHR